MMYPEDSYARDTNIPRVSHRFADRWLIYLPIPIAPPPLISILVLLRFLRTETLIRLTHGIGVSHEGFQRATADHPELAELERVNAPLLRHAPQILVVVARESNRLSQ